MLWKISVNSYIYIYYTIYYTLGFLEDTLEDTHVKLRRCLIIQSLSIFLKLLHVAARKLAQVTSADGRKRPVEKEINTL